MENELPNPGRIPTTSDLVVLCRALNEAGARYLVIGGFAINYHGYIRATEDIDIWSRPTLRIKGELNRRWRSCQTRRFEN